MKTVLLLPGFNEGLHSRDYNKTIKTIESRNYKVKFVAISWLRTTANDWVEQLEKTYKNYKTANTILAGFSYGAVTAFVAASRHNPSELWLFSLSPRFHEDMPNLPKSTINQIGKRRLAAFNNLIFSTAAKNIKCKTLIFVGGTESKKDPALLKRAKSANKLIVSSTLVSMPDVPHDISDKNYLKAIEQNI